MILEHDAYLFVGWSAHELVFSGLSWRTLDKPFWLDVGNISSLAGPGSTIDSIDACPRWFAWVFVWICYLGVSLHGAGIGRRVYHHLLLLIGVRATSMVFDFRNTAAEGCNATVGMHPEPTHPKHTPHITHARSTRSDPACRIIA